MKLWIKDERMVEFRFGGGKIVLFRDLILISSFTIKLN